MARPPKPADFAQQLEQLEDRVAHAYQDSKGYTTIGVGRLIDKRKGGRLRDDEIDLLLRNDIAEKTAEVYKALPWVRNLSAPRQAVIIGMAFQMGIGNAKTGTGLLGFKNTLENMRLGNHDKVRAGMLASKWARSDTPNRAKLLARQWVTDEWQAVDW